MFFHAPTCNLLYRFPIRSGDFFIKKPNQVRLLKISIYSSFFF